MGQVNTFPAKLMELCKFTAVGKGWLLDIAHSLPVFSVIIIITQAPQCKAEGGNNAPEILLLLPITYVSWAKSSAGEINQLTPV